VSRFEEITRQNMTMFENAMKVWTPFASSSSKNSADKIQELQKNISDIEKEISRLSGQK
jgi:polyhydroxyalkanoate synthesis regulator protein